MMCAALVPCAARAQSAPTLTKAEAAQISSPPGKPCAAIVNAVVQKGTWASFFVTCPDGPAGISPIARYAGGKWSVVCGHGDDVLFAEDAVGKCPGLTLSQAVAIGLPPQDPEHYDLTDPVQAVEKYYALWERKKYPEMYQMLSASYRAANPYASWLSSHNTTTEISVTAKPASSPSAVSVDITSTDSKDGDQRFTGTWNLVGAGGTWKLDKVELQEVKQP